MPFLSVKQQRRLIRTRHNPGSTKFGKKKPWAGASLPGLSTAEKAQLSWLAGHSVAQNTWRTYNTAANLFKWFCSEKNLSPELPASADTVTRFVLWLSFVRKVSQATISVYLAGLRQLHVQHGVDCPALRSDFTKMLLQGKKNSESRNTNSTAAAGRQPATAETMTSIKDALRVSEYDTYTRRLIWTVCSILFFGTLRSSEILCVNTSAFDPRFSACAEDISLAINKNSGEKKLVITVKTPKEEKTGANTKIEIYKAKSEQLCAVVSWEKWSALHPPLESGQPVFRHQSGAPFTQAELNRALKKLLPDQHISSHSFRIGAATEMGVRGYNDDDIKLAGRWNSAAFNRYVRKGKSRRSAVAAKFSSEL